MTQVRIPPVLRASADGNKQVEVEGATVGEVLGQLVGRFPGLRDQLFSAEGDLNRFVNVYLNSEDVRYLSELETPAGASDTIVVLPAMAGGARPRSAPSSPNGEPPRNRRIPTRGVVGATAGRSVGRLDQSRP